MTELDTQIRGMQAAVVDAAGTGDADTFAQEQDKLAKIEARKAAISTQIKMLRAAHVRGSEELYQAACDAYSDLAKANSAYEKALDEIHLATEEQAKVWDKLEEKSEYTHWYANIGQFSCKGGEVRAFERVREHYNAQPETSSPKRKNLRPSSISNWLAIKWGYIRTRDTSPLRRAGAGTVPCKPFKAQMARESGALSTGGVAPSPSRHRRAEGGEMRCNRRRRQKVL